MVRRELRRPSGLPCERRRWPSRTVSGRRGLRRGHCPLLGSGAAALARTDVPGVRLDRAAAIRLVRASARGYCWLVALDHAGARVADRRRQGLKSVARLIRFAYLLASGGIQYSPALATALTRLLREVG